MGWKGKGVQELILSLFSVSSHSLRSFVSPPFHSIPLISGHVYRRGRDSDIK